MLQKLSILALFFILTSCASKKTAPQMSKGAEIYFNSGTQSLMDQRYTEALQHLTKANELDPGNSQIMNNLGMAYYLKGHRDLGVRTIEEVIELDPKNSDAKSNLAAIAMKENDNAKAEKLFNDVLKDLVYDKQAITNYNLGILAMRRHDTAQAKTFFQKSIVEDNNYCPSQFRLGVFSLEERKLKKALSYFRDASMGVCYQDPSPTYYQALTLIELKRFDEARLKLNEVETRFPRSPYAQKSRQKMSQITQMELKHSDSNNNTFHANGSKMESPEF